MNAEDALEIDLMRFGVIFEDIDLVATMQLSQRGSKFALRLESKGREKFALNGTE